MIRLRETLDRASERSRAAPAGRAVVAQHDTLPASSAQVNRRRGELWLGPMPGCTGSYAWIVVASPTSPNC